MQTRRASRLMALGLLLLGAALVWLVVPPRPAQAAGSDDASARSGGDAAALDAADADEPR